METEGLLLELLAEELLDFGCDKCLCAVLFSLLTDSVVLCGFAVRRLLSGI